MAENEGRTSKRGLASADPETRKRVASMGGKASHRGRTNNNAQEGG